MTTATRRLRRSAVATFAATVAAGAALIATTGSAFAAEATVTDQIGTVTATTLVAPAATGAAGDLQVSLPNSWHIGDTVTLQLSAAPGCGTTAGAVGFSSLPTITTGASSTGTFGSGSAGSISDVTPTFTSALASSAGACTIASIHDQVLLTFTNSSAGTATDNYQISFTTQHLFVGASVSAGAVTEKPGGGTAVTIATVAAPSMTVTATSVAPPTSGTAPVIVNPITIADVGAPIITSPITLVLSAGTWTTGVTPTVTPAGYTVTGLGTATLTLTGSPSTTALNSIVVTGASVTIPTGKATYTVTGHTAGVTLAATNLVVALPQGRVGGIDRYSTAAQLYSTKFAGNHSVVIASGTNYPDALSAAYLAASLTTAQGGPSGVLLTDPNTLPQATSTVLVNGAINTVYLVGGTSAISAGVQNAIAALHVGNNPISGANLIVVRIAGADRYATNALADLFSGVAPASQTAVVATGTNFADALSVGPALYSQKDPLVLTDPSTLSASAKSTLLNLGIKKVIIVGGTSAVSAAVETAINAVSTSIKVTYRIAGADRTQTAAQIASWETAGLPATSTYSLLTSLAFPFGVATGNVFIARGDGFADALGAGPVAGTATLSEILLTGDPTTLGAGIPAFFSGANAHVGNVTGIGLTAALSVATLSAAIASLT